MSCATCGDLKAREIAKGEDRDISAHVRVSEAEDAAYQNLTGFRLILTLSLTEYGEAVFVKDTRDLLEATIADQEDDLGAVTFHFVKTDTSPDSVTAGPYYGEMWLADSEDNRERIMEPTVFNITGTSMTQAIWDDNA